MRHRAELVVRTLERIWVQQQALVGAEQHRQTLMRTMSCYSRGYLLVDATPAGLSLIHMNTAACQQLSASRSETFHIFVRKHPHGQGKSSTSY
jgi:hypothetical protein